ncbi:hypothetical protein BDP27DRAFT_1452995 [Rhodocollybia butyracea]|uniref:Myb/SANT-like domain-containing protein n=1 Tax=Rhodocollybia butyracea TaxID=206335 RepID=A0A9P5TZ30_9AGAR|nr:hypothetical protein BDP27DRAFT_1452995 [Rhodocollybia butyracea]
MPSDNIPPENDTGNTSDHPETAPSMTSKGQPNTRPRKPRKKMGSASGTQTMNPEVDTGDGGSYPMAIYNEAAVECNKIRSQGANKPGAMCKKKWSTGLRPIWKICCEIDTRSGLGGFDTKKGAHITAESEHVWADFVKSNPSVAPYKHKGWV